MGAHLIVENMASNAPSASAERNSLGKKLNSQTKYLLMKLWEYFKQEVKKCKISINITERILKATGFGIHYAIQVFKGHPLEWSTERKAVYLRQEKGTKCTLHKPTQL